MIELLSRKEVAIATLLSISIISLIVPYGFPLFGSMVIFFTFLHFITGRIRFRFSIGFILFMICVLFYLLGLIQNPGTIFNHNKSEIINIVSFILIFVMLSDMTKEMYKTTIDIFAKIVSNVGFAVSIFAIIKFVALLGGVQFAFLYNGTNYPLGTSLVNDYNMFTFGMFAGLFMSLYMASKSNSALLISYYYLSFVTCTIVIFFAGSRRGWLIAAAVALFLLAKALIYILKNLTNKRLFKIGFSISYVLIFSFLVFKLFGGNITVSADEELEKIKYRFETVQADNLDSSFSSRTNRWDYSEELIRDMNVLQTAVGSGFGYLPEFANRFNPKLTEDYPHNPIISTMLYSGILGVLSLLALLVWSFYQTFRNRKLLSIYFVLIYLVSWPFMLISANTIFSVKLFLILIVFVSSIPINTEKTINKEAAVTN